MHPLNPVITAAVLDEITSNRRRAADRAAARQSRSPFGGLRRRAAARRDRSPVAMSRPRATARAGRA